MFSTMSGVTSDHGAPQTYGVTLFACDLCGNIMSLILPWDLQAISDIAGICKVGYFTTRSWLVGVAVVALYVVY